MSSAREWFESLPKVEFEEAVICPKCGEFFYRHSPDEPCRYCGNEQIIPLTPQQDEFRGADNKKQAEERIRQKYVDQTSPIFDRELYLKRQAKDEAEYREIRATFSNDTGTYVPRCPTCGSPNVFNRGNGAGKSVYGLMVHKQYVCNNCGYEW